MVDPSRIDGGFLFFFLLGFGGIFRDFTTEL